MPNALDWVTGVGQVGAVVFAAWAAKSASDSADAARDALREQSRPFIVPSSAAPTFDLVEGEFSLGLRNVGRGPARLTGYRLRLVGLDTSFEFQAPIYGTLAVPADGEAVLRERLVPPEIQARLTALPRDDKRGLAVWLDYTDYVGEQRQWIVFRLVATDSSAPLVVQSARNGDYGSDVDPATLNVPPDGVV